MAGRGVALVSITGTDARAEAPTGLERERDGRKREAGSKNESEGSRVQSPESKRREEKSLWMSTRMCMRMRMRM